MNNTILKIISIALLITLFSCKKGPAYKGSGVIITENRALGSFDKITTVGSIDIVVKYGATQSVKVTADDNLISNIYTFISNSTLHVKLKEGNYTNNYTLVTVTIPAISKIKNSGSSDYIISGFSNIPSFVIYNSGSGDFKIDASLDNFSIHNSGSGDFNLGGSVQDFSIHNSGSGDLNGFNFVAKNCHLSNNGSGDISIYCTSVLSGKNSGSGDIYYKGNPRVSVSNSGSGNIINKN